MSEKGDVVTYRTIAVPRGELGEVPARADGAFYPLSMRLRGRMVLADTFADLVAYMLRRSDYPCLPAEQQGALRVELAADRRRSVQKKINEEMADAFDACTREEQEILTSPEHPRSPMAWGGRCPLVAVDVLSPSDHGDPSDPDDVVSDRPQGRYSTTEPSAAVGQYALEQAILWIETTTDAAFIRSLQYLGVLDLGFVPTREGDALRDEQ